jgi:hypothetical protein
VQLRARARNLAASVKAARAPIVGSAMRNLLLAVTLVTACAHRVETYSHATRVSLRFTNTCNAELRRNAGAGKPETVRIVDSKAIIDVPAMGGGYTVRRGRTSDVHDPATYPVVVLKDGDRVLVELSLEQIRELPLDQDGFSLVDVRC